MIQNLQPELVSFKELGLEITNADTTLVSDWIASHATTVELLHGHVTCRDERHSSTIRKTNGILNNPGVDSRVQWIVKEIHDASLERAKNLLGKTSVSAWKSAYAAVGHLYFPGDDKPTEGHVDSFPSATAYFEVPSEGGRLFIANSTAATGLKDIGDDSTILIPEPGTIAFFDDQQYPHFVEGVPENAEGYRTSINFSFYEEDTLGGESLEEYGTGAYFYNTAYKGDAS